MRQAVVGVVGSDKSITLNGRGIEPFNALSDDRLRTCAFLSAHLTFEEADSRFRSVGIAPYYFAVVRDPIARLISNYTYIKTVPNHPYRDTYGRLPFHEFARIELPFGVMCKQLSGYSDAEKAIEFINREFLCVGAMKRLDVITTMLGAFLNSPLVLASANLTHGEVKTDFDSDLCRELLIRTEQDRLLHEAAIKASTAGHPLGSALPPLDGNSLNLLTPNRAS